MQASSTTWAHTMTIQKLELYIHVVDTDCNWISLVNEFEQVGFS